MRLGLLGTVAFIVQLTEPVFTACRPRLLLARHDPDRGRPVPGLEGHQGDPPQRGSRSRAPTCSTSAASLGFGAAIGQILLLDLVFSIDSIITAVGMTEHVPIMVVAVIVAVAVMLLAADPLANFIHANPTVVMLALGFLLMIGMTLIAEGFGVHVPKGYIYAAMAFSAAGRGPQHAAPGARQPAGNHVRPIVQPCSARQCPCQGRTGDEAFEGLALSGEVDAAHRRKCVRGNQDEIHLSERTPAVIADAAIPALPPSAGPRPTNRHGLNQAARKRPPAE